MWMSDTGDVCVSAGHSYLMMNMSLVYVSMLEGESKNVEVSVV